MKSLATLPEAFVSDKAITRAVSRGLKAGQLRRLASRLYTSSLNDAPEVVVARNLWGIVAGYFPAALIADRTALENAPASDGSVCLVTAHGRDINLPGIKLRPRRGHGPLASDGAFLRHLFLSSSARAYLENMRVSRARGRRVARTLRPEEVEARLDALIRHSGEQAVNQLRDEARALAPVLDLSKEGRKLVYCVINSRSSEGEKLPRARRVPQLMSRPLQGAQRSHRRFFTLPKGAQEKACGRA